MNRIIEDRLLLDECEKVFLSLNETAIKNGIKSSTLSKILQKIKMHREKFTKRILDKEEYIRKNVKLFDVIYEREFRVVAGSFFKWPKDTDAYKYEINIYDDLVKQGFYSKKTARMDVMRSLMKTYKKIFEKE